MARRRYLIAYDISEPRRLRRVIKVMEAYGERLQYSVFLCDLSGRELVAWQHDITKVIARDEDSVIRIDLGPLDASAAITVIGTPRTLPSTGAIVT